MYGRRVTAREKGRSEKTSPRQERNYLGVELDPQYHAAATKRLHPDGIRANGEFYPPQRKQASRPMPSGGDAQEVVRSLDSCFAALSFCFSSLECRSCSEIRNCDD
jgi:hypothetical protein